MIYNIEYKRIPNAPNYGISNDGQVINLDSGRKLRPALNAIGYYLFSVGGGRKLSVHREVAKLYVANPNGYPIINHKDGNKKNNHYTNLEWVTHSENTKHAFRIGLISHGCEGKFGKDNPKSKPILQYNLSGELVREWENARQAEREAGFNNGTISEVCKGKHKSHKGFVFKFK